MAAAINLGMIWAAIAIGMSGFFTASTAAAMLYTCATDLVRHT
jgi:hypothetical protein